MLPLSQQAGDMPMHRVESIRYAMQHPVHAHRVMQNVHFVEWLGVRSRAALSLGW